MNVVQEKALAIAADRERKVNTVKVGGIVFFERKQAGKFNWTPYYGIIKQVFMDGVEVDTLTTHKEYELAATGELIDKNTFPTMWFRYKKIGEVDEGYRIVNGESLKQRLSTLTFRNEDIEQAIKEGYIVRWHEDPLYNARIKALYDDDKCTYRLDLSYSDAHHEPTDALLKWSDFYLTYEDWQRHHEAERAERERLMSLTDEEWSIEMIDITLETWKGLYTISDSQYEETRNWLLSLKNIEDVEIRMYCKAIQWKYFRKKGNWKDVVCSLQAS